MPRFEHVIAALRRYDRYHALDLFVDDVDEFRTRAFATDQTLEVQPLRVLPQPAWQVAGGERFLTATLLSRKGILRFHLREKTGTAIALSADQSTELNTIITGAIETARLEKQGLLGDLVIGMLVGPHIGTPAGPVGQRILAIRFDPATGVWRAYDGPHLAWARQHLVFES
jgi:hypothetical protein